MKKIGIIAKQNHPEISAFLPLLIEFLKQKGIMVILEDEMKGYAEGAEFLPRPDILSNSDMVMVLGGDGTLLSVARIMGEDSVPSLGINLGSLGFLTEVPLDDIYNSLELVLRGDYHIDERMMLNAKVTRRGEKIAEYNVLNDVVISNGSLSRILELEVFIDSLYVTTYKSDGLILSTPTGSTGHSLSAGGPIVYPVLKNIIITPICPHTLTNRPIIIPDTSIIKVVVNRQKDEAAATFDGQVGISLSPSDIIEVKKADYPFRLIASPFKSYYEILRTKLKWGER